MPVKKFGTSRLVSGLDPKNRARVIRSEKAASARRRGRKIRKAIRTVVKKVTKPFRKKN